MLNCSCGSLLFIVVVNKSWGIFLSVSEWKQSVLLSLHSNNNTNSRVNGAHFFLLFREKKRKNVMLIEFHPILMWKIRFQLGNSWHNCEISAISRKWKMKFMIASNMEFSEWARWWMKTKTEWNAETWNTNAFGLIMMSPPFPAISAETRT